MSRLLALYPKAWRARYGDEFADLLEQRPPTLRDRLDIVIGAIDARVNPQVPGSETREVQVAGDRLARITAVTTGLLFTIWGVLSVTFMVPWESGLEPAGPEILMALAWMSGMLGACLAPVSFAIIGFRYERALGSVGLLGALLTPVGLITAALGMGIQSLIVLAAGVILFSWRARGRIVNTRVAVGFAAGGLLVAAGFLMFTASNGQNLLLLWPIVALGPSWVMLGVGLRKPLALPESDATPAISPAGA